MKKKPVRQMPWKRELEPIVLPEARRPFLPFHARPTEPLMLGEQPNRATHQVRGHYCPACGKTTLPYHALFCDFCGNHLG